MRFMISTSEFDRLFSFSGNPEFDAWLEEMDMEVPAAMCCGQRTMLIFLDAAEAVAFKLRWL